MIRTGEVRATAMDKVIFGKPSAEALASEVNRLGAKNVFLMVSGSLRRESDVIDQAITALGEKFAGVFDAMPPHTPREAVIEAAALARNADADLIVTIGGGSLTDGAKVVQICLQHNIDNIEGLDDYHVQTSADGKVVQPEFEAPSVRQITVPTTLSGGEFNPHAGCTDSRIKVKQGYRHPLIVPVSVILDPVATLLTPQWLWLSTGMRAVDHAVEGFCSGKSNSYHDGFCLQALRLLYDGLRACKADGNDLAARLNCQIGAWLSMAGVMSGVPMGASHAIGHILGGTCDVPHGYTSCIMLPQVLRFNASVNGERQALLSAALGKPTVSAGDLISELVEDLGLPGRLGEVEVTAAQSDLIAKNAMHDRWLHTNPRKIAGPEQVVEILQMAA